MKLSPEMLEILACPKCKGALRVDDDQQRFECHACRLAYPTNEDGIPVFLIEEALPLDSVGDA